MEYVEYALKYVIRVHIPSKSTFIWVQSNQYIDILQFKQSQIKLQRQIDTLTGRKSVGDSTNLLDFNETVDNVNSMKS